MSRTIFAFIWRYSRKEQVILLLLTAISFPFLYYSLDLPKTIINKAIDGHDFPRRLLGTEFDQIPYLLVLCLVYLALVFVNGGFKYYINVFRGSMAERMLRRLRYQLIERILRFPLARFRKASQGEIVAMVTSETEPLGGFLGDALEVPAYQGGTLLTIIAFMFIQDPFMGLAAISLYPVQGWLIPKLQRQVNTLGRERVRTVRKLSERVGEIVSGAHEVHANDTSRYELAEFTNRLGTIYGIRLDIYRKKFFIKFLNNFLAQLTPFFFFLIGGYLVIRSELTFGALVAVLAAYKDMTAPWKELLAYYQLKEDARIKYEQLIAQFEIPGLMDPALLTAEPAGDEVLRGPLVVSNVTLEEDEGTKVIDGASLAVEFPAHVGLTGPGAGGKTELARLLGRQIFPTKGRIEINGRNLAELPEAVTGRRIGYVGQEGYIPSGTVRDALLYGLKHLPLREAPGDGAERWHRGVGRTEAVHSGNSTDDFHADWIDYRAAGCDDLDALQARIVHVLGLVGMEQDILQLGLRRTVAPEANATLIAGVLEARALFRRHMVTEADAARLVEPFDAHRYNTNASVAENILFGTPVGPTFAIDNLGNNPFLLMLLEDEKLTADLVAIGLRLAQIMVDLFSDLAPGHEFFERYSFIGSDDLPEFQRVLRQIEAGGSEAPRGDDRSRLLGLAFKFIPARHHLDLIDGPMRERLLTARRAFAAKLPVELVPAVQFFDVKVYNAASTIQDNILFGRAAWDKAHSTTRVGALVTRVIDELHLRPAIMDAGLDFEVGIGGSRLTVGQRQRLAVARAILKRPDLVIVNEALTAVDPTARPVVLRNLKAELDGRGLVWVESEIPTDAGFQQVISVEAGKVRTGTAAAGPSTVVAPAAAAAGSEEPTGLAKEVEVLAAIPLFAGMDRSTLKFLAFTSRRLTHEAGDTIFSQGEAGDRACVILDGSADVVLETAEGPKVLATIGEGELFGELALICDTVRSATVRAATRLTVLSIAKDLFMRLVAENAQVSANIARAIARRLEGTLQEFGRANVMYDAVTQLPTFSLLADRAQLAIAQDRREGRRSVLCTIDLADLAGAVPDLDRKSREAILREVAERLRKITRRVDTVAFLRGLEFAILLNQTHEDGEPEILARRIAAALTIPFQINGLDLDLGRSFRFNVSPLEEGDLNRILEACRGGAAKVLSIEL